MSVRHSPYEILGIEATATEREAKRRYQQLIREFTPEHSPEKFAAIREAYETIKNAGLGSQDKFPIYRKPLDWLAAQQGGGQPAAATASLMHDAFAQVFETPFNTTAELKNLLRKVRKNW